MADQTGTTVAVWDLPTRLFHWSLVALVCFSGVTGEFAEAFGSKVIEWHKLSGYTILTLLLFRLLWGFFGGTYARFGNFLRGPRAVISYLKVQAVGGKSATQLGHNPLGGWSVALMLLCLLLQACTGLFISDEDLGFEGPLARHISSHTADQLKAVHHANFVVLLGLVGMHLAAIGFYLVAKGENLVRPMLLGKKPLPEDCDPADHAARGGHPWLGLGVFVIAAATVWFIVNRL